MQKIKGSIFNRLFNKFNASLTIITGFGLIILTGAILLSMPFSSAQGTFTPFLNSLFTATSATCVTGLVVYDTAIHWSVFGKIVIISLIQIGGLGFMTMGLLFSMIIGKKISPKTRITMATSISLGSSEGIFKMTKKILIGTFSMELLGAILLSVRFIPIFGVADGISKSIFHAISAFCNAGFDLFGNYSGEFSSITAFYGDPLVNFTIAFLIIFGGLGFIVWNDVVKYRKNKRLSLYTKLVIIITSILIIGGMLLFLGFEWNNEGTIGNFSIKDKLLASFFQSVTCRTAGFNTVDLTAATDLSKLLMMILMFIGGSAGSTAGGIKTVTFGILVISMFQISIGNHDIVIGKKTINQNNVLRALSIFTYAAVFCLITAVVITLSSGTKLINSLFESVSAFATVGLSLGLTPTLPLISKLFLIILMYFGRVGVLTITLATLVRMSKNQNIIAYPEEKIYIS